MLVSGWIRALATLCVVFVPVAAPALVIEDFEGYADTAALEAAWVDQVGSPVQTLETTILYEGSQALRLDYASGVGSLRHALSPDQDWTAYDFFQLWVYGDPTNSSEGISLGLAGSLGILGSVNAPSATQIDSWTLIEYDLSLFAPLSSVNTIYLGMWPEDSGSGSIVIDALGLRQVPEPGTGLLLALGMLGLGAWRRGSRRRT